MRDLLPVCGSNGNPAIAAGTFDCSPVDEAGCGYEERKGLNIGLSNRPVHRDLEPDRDRGEGDKANAQRLRPLEGMRVVVAVLIVVVIMVVVAMVIVAAVPVPGRDLRRGGARERLVGKVVPQPRSLGVVRHGFPHFR